MGETLKDFERKIEKISRIQRLFSPEKIFFSAEEKFFSSLKSSKSIQKQQKTKTKKSGFVRFLREKTENFYWKNHWKSENFGQNSVNKMLKKLNFLWIKGVIWCM